MTTVVKLDDISIEPSQPLTHRPDVIVIAASDGRKTILGDGQDPFTTDEYRQIASNKRRKELEL